MTRAELIAQSRFQQSMQVLTADRSKRSYGLQASAGTIGNRDPKTGDRTFTDNLGVSTPARDLMTGAYPSGHDAAGVRVRGGKTYVR